MSKFKPNEFNIVDDKEKKSGVRVMKGATPDKSAGTNYQPDNFRESGGENYQALKSKYGALAATDEEMLSREQKDSRFNLSPLVKGPLQIEAEETRALEDRVRAGVAELSEQAEIAGRTKGFQEGLEAGKKESFDAFRKDGEVRSIRLTALLDELEGAKNELFKANEKFLIEVIFRVARMVILKELTTDKDYLIRLTRELIERAGVRENIKVRIHPDDITTIAMLQEGLEKRMGTLKNLNIQTATHVKLGGCEIETEWNAIEASIETQLEGLRASLVAEEGKSSS